MNLAAADRSLNEEPSPVEEKPAPEITPEDANPELQIASTQVEEAADAENDDAMEVSKKETPSDEEPLVPETGEVQEFATISDLGTLSLFQQQTNDFDTYKTVLEKSISPFSYSGNANLTWAIVLMIIGFLTIFILESIGKSKSD